MTRNDRQQGKPGWKRGNSGRGRTKNPSRQPPEMRDQYTRPLAASSAIKPKD